MKVKVSEASGPVLDWMVAKCEGDEYIAESGVNGIGMEYEATSYSTDWSQGGPIIEREEIGLKRKLPCSKGWEWEALPSISAKGAGGRWGLGPTPLIAAMRCYVSSKLGDEVEVPDDLS